MTEIQCIPAYEAFESQLKTLCLHEFPCGNGLWRETCENDSTYPSTPYSPTKTAFSRNVNFSPVKTPYSRKPPPTSTTTISHVKVKSYLTPLPTTAASNVQRYTPLPTAATQYSVTLKDYGAQYEKTESLQEFVSSKHSPWKLDYSWSNEAKELREIAVKSPWIVDKKFVLNYFKSLRIVDRNVTEVDKSILKFPNLEELVLSANYIQSVNSKNLPPKLSVLELCANQIVDVSPLCIRPPPLTHLGLGYNSINTIDDYITGELWPNLLSLDLSFNNLADLMDIVRKMITLPHLRNLVLIGNPLSLIPGYRGYVIDSLKKLQILDDIRISADEKHQFKGLSKGKEYILDEAKVRFEVVSVKGIPTPPEVKDPDDFPEYPIITRKYCVQFNFLEDSSAKAEVFDLLGMGSESPTIMDTERTGNTDEVLENQFLDPGNTDVEVSSILDQKSVAFATSTEEINILEPVIDERPPTVESQRPASTCGSQLTATSEAVTEGTPKTYVTAPLRSLPVQFSNEEMDLNWFKNVTRDNLIGLRDFFKDGIELSVVEEKVLSYPADEEDDGSRAGSAKKKKSADKKDAKGGKDDKKDDKKKKKKDAEIELKHSAPEYTTLATFNLPLESFLEGEYEIEETFTQDEVDNDGRDSSLEKPGAKKGKKDKKKPGSGKKKDAKDAKGDKGGRSTPKSPKGKKEEKGKGKGKAAEEATDEDQGPPPLEVKVKLKLIQWTSASDSLKAEQERAQMNSGGTKRSDANPES